MIVILLKLFYFVILVKPSAAEEGDDVDNGML